MQSINWAGWRAKAVFYAQAASALDAVLSKTAELYEAYGLAYLGQSISASYASARGFHGRTDMPAVASGEQAIHKARDGEQYGPGASIFLVRRIGRKADCQRCCNGSGEITEGRH
jgi:hypothetical protein